MSEAQNSPSQFLPDSSTDLKKLLTPEDYARLQETGVIDGSGQVNWQVAEKQTEEAQKLKKLLKAMPEPSFTLKDVMSMMSAVLKEQAEQHDKSLEKVVQAITEPQRKKDEEERQKLIRRAAMASREATIEQQVRQGNQARCSHKKKDGSPAWGGQVNGDGYVRPMCVQCYKIMPEIKAPQEWLTGGVNFQDKEIFPELTEEMLLAWHREWGAKPKKPLLPQPEPSQVGA